MKALRSILMSALAAVSTCAPLQSQFSKTDGPQTGICEGLTAARGESGGCLPGLVSIESWRLPLRTIAPGWNLSADPPDKNSLLISVHPYHDDVSFQQTDFKPLPHTTVTVHNSHSNADETYSGVPLADLLTRFGAPLGKELHGHALALYIVATGSDGYQAVLSLAEVDPSFHPGDVIVADTMDAKPLDTKAGPFKLVVTEDKRPARCVRNLVSLQLKAAD